MERLTERTTDGISVKEDYGEDALKTIYQCYGTEVMPHYANCDEGYCAMEKLTEYEDLEEQGKLLKLPCAIGNTVYDIVPKNVFKPNLTELEVREYQNVDLIYIAKRFDDFGKTVFPTKEESETALQKMKETGGQ